MSELDETLQSILGDPKQLEKVAGLAAQLMGGVEKKEQPEAAPTGSFDGIGDLLGGIDAGSLAKIAGVVTSLGGAKDSDKLFTALHPLLAPKRSEKLKKAIQIAKIVRVAENFIGKGGFMDV